MRLTSVESHRTLVKSGQLTMTYQVIIEAVKEHGPCTAAELRAVAELPKGSWKRLPELRRAGFLAEDGVRKCAVTNHMAIVWAFKSVVGERPTQVKSKSRPWLLERIRELEATVNDLTTRLSRGSRRRNHLSQLDSKQPKLL